MSEWKTAYKDDTLIVWNRGDKWWYEVPAPRKFFHRHTAQTKAHMGFDRYTMSRCACGAVAFSDIPGWTRRER